MGNWILDHGSKSFMVILMEEEKTGSCENYR
jgi:hypothetical protein